MPTTPDTCPNCGGPDLYVIERTASTCTHEIRDEYAAWIRNRPRRDTSDDIHWRGCLEAAMREAKDPGPVIAYAPNQATFDIMFDGGFGSPHGPDCLAWTETRVYFPLEYDGAERIGSAPRNPQAKGQHHA